MDPTTQPAPCTGRPELPIWSSCGRSGVSHAGRRVTRVSAPTQEPLFDPLELGGVTVDTTLLPSVEICIPPSRSGSGSDSRTGRPQRRKRPGRRSRAWEQYILVAAPTGSGKTLAGFLMAINRLYLAYAAANRSAARGSSTSRR